MVNANPALDAEILSIKRDNGDIGVKVRETGRDACDRLYGRERVIWLWSEDLTGEESEGDIETMALETMQDLALNDEWQPMEGRL